MMPLLPLPPIDDGWMDVRSMEHGHIGTAGGLETGRGGAWTHPAGGRETDAGSGAPHALQVHTLDLKSRCGEREAEGAPGRRTTGTGGARTETHRWAL